MKKQITLLFIAFILNVIDVNAQTNFLYEMLYPMSGTVGPKLPHFELFYGHPVVVTQVADTVQLGKWNNTQKTESPKDAFGRFTRFKSYSWDSIRWKTGNGFNYAFNYVYNTQGKLLQYTRMQGQSDTISGRQDMTYTFNGPASKPSLGIGIDSILTTSRAIPYGGRVDSFTYNGSDLTEFSSYRIQGSNKFLDRKWQYTFASGRAISWIDNSSDGSGGFRPTAKECLVLK